MSEYKITMFWVSILWCFGEKYQCSPGTFGAASKIQDITPHNLKNRFHEEGFTFMQYTSDNTTVAVNVSRSVRPRSVRSKGLWQWYIDTIAVSGHYTSSWFYLKHKSSVTEFFSIFRWNLLSWAKSVWQVPIFFMCFKWKQDDG